MPAVPNCYCLKRLVPYWSNLPVLIFDIRALWRSGLSARVTECQKSKLMGYVSMAKCKALTGSAVKGLMNGAVWSVRRVPPHFSILPESTEVIEGGAVNLTCVAVGSPMPYVRWQRGSVDVPSVPGQLGAPTPIGRNVLQLTEVRQTATYTCIASSELGSIEHHAEVRVRGKNSNITIVMVSPSLHSDPGPLVDISRGIFHCCFRTFLFSKFFPSIAVYPFLRLISWNCDQSLFGSHWRR